MTCTFRNATMDDIAIVLKNSTENGKVDEDVITDSSEIRVMTCDGEPIMVIGCITYDRDDLTDVLGVWGIFSKEIKKHTREAVTFCKDLIFDRVGTKFIVLIDERQPVFKRFVEFFGFQRTKVVEEKNGMVYHVYVKVN